MRIDTFAYSNRWRNLHPGEKGLFALLSLIASLLSSSALVPLLVAAVMAAATLLGARIPWREYLRLAALPAIFLLWSCLLLAVSFSGGDILLVKFPPLHLTVSLSHSGIERGELALARSMGATLSLLFLALSTPMTEIMALLKTLGIPKLLIELMTITYRQLFIFMEIAGQIRAAQEARLGYASNGSTMKSLGGLSGNILMRSLSRARGNHQGLLARGYDSEILFLSPPRSLSPFNLIGGGVFGTTLIILALTIKP